MANKINKTLEKIANVSVGAMGLSTIGVGIASMCGEYEIAEFFMQGLAGSSVLTFGLAPLLGINTYNKEKDLDERKLIAESYGY
ncbi:MAG: hypothetical protein KJ646_02605 [Nanoarchaeota archaeon]|nr:hypothetical protein [Nanoarchaeota archaeon]MBU4116450.1 hypothetical protein [Nanoarchaeota archaeon]